MDDRRIVVNCGVLFCFDRRFVLHCCDRRSGMLCVALL